MKFKVITAYTAMSRVSMTDIVGELQQKVQDALDEGWILEGPFSIVRGHNHCEYIATQAMIRYEDADTINEAVVEYGTDLLAFEADVHSDGVVLQ